MIDYKSEYKDLSTEKTIFKAKEILSKINMNMIEDNVICNHGLYSMRLICPELNWYTNGKGLTLELCRASAYGEAMERIQNLQFCKSLSEKLLDCHDKTAISCFPDEIELSYEKIIDQCPFVKQDMINSYIESDGVIPSNEELKNVWTSFNESDLFKCIPFYSLNDNSVEYLPYNILQRLVRSNGTAAGNTVEEALCQSISEILERHSQEMIYRYNYTPPIIPISYIKERYPYLYNIIDTIKQKYGLTLYIMDASLGKGLPVLCLLCVNKASQHYRIKFGAHPIFRIALERCLTEFAQGNNFAPETLEQLMIEWNDENQANYDTLYNWGINHRKNLGSVPDTFFYKKKSWEFKPWHEFENYNNKAGLLYLLDVCKRVSDRVYIRNNSFLGFYSFWVYIPGISPTYKFHPLGKSTLLPKRLEKIIRNPRKFVSELSVDDKKALVEILKADSIYYNFEYWDFTKNIIRAALYLDVGNLDIAIEELKKEKKPTSYVLACIRELEMRKRGIPIQDRDEMLKLFFGDDILFYVAKNWRTGNVLSCIFNPFNFNNHQKELEQTKKETELFIEIKNSIDKIMSQNIIDQNQIISV